MELQNELERLTRFVPINALSEQLNNPITYLGEVVTHILPSIEMKPDGLGLVRVLLVTENFLCDVEIGGSEFDIISKRSIFDYRFRIWSHDLKDGDVVKASYEVARIELLHTESFRTILTYAGNERTEWLNQVLEAIPIRLVLVK